MLLYSLFTFKKKMLSNDESFDMSISYILIYNILIFYIVYTIIEIIFNYTNRVRGRYKEII